LVKIFLYAAAPRLNYPFRIRGSYGDTIILIEKHPESEGAEAGNLIIEKIMGGEEKW